MSPTSFPASVTHVLLALLVSTGCSAATPFSRDPDLAAALADERPDPFALGPRVDLCPMASLPDEPAGRAERRAARERREIESLLRAHGEGAP